ncbi:MAG: 2OG-Fe(II) oxygenase [Burkholderiales bacterium]|nr:2OG-Fe(II) oxygenase [Burkholderiales bacterium]
MQDVIVIDQAVPKVIQDMLENVALGDKIPWMRNGGATYGDNAAKIFPTTASAVDAQQFTHLVFDSKQPVSQLFPVLLPVLTAIPYTIKQLIRIKMNLGVYADLANPDAHGMPHVDFTEIKEPLMTAIYYVNDATGDTILFDQRFGHKGALTVRTRIAPKKGRLVVFDGGLLHAGNTPRTNRPRVNINFNAFVYEGAQTLEQAAA